MKKLILITNDYLKLNNNSVSSNYNDTINIIQAISKNNFLYFLCRQKNIKGIFKTFLKKKKKLKFSDIFSLNFSDKSIFMISITPFNFMIYFLIKLFNKNLNGFVYLRSDGHKEYFIKYGFLGKIIYQFFFTRILKDLNVITVSKNLTGVHNYKTFRVFPSEIDDGWKKNLKKTSTKKAKLFYLGRVKKEKGVFSLINLLNKFSIDFDLNILGATKIKKSSSTKIKYHLETSRKRKIIEFFDKNNIFILPSYTEGCPKVVLESLSRLRPVIIFNEISHVKGNFKGVFVSNRNPKSLQKTIIYILNNYKKIQKSMKNNKISSKLKFQTDLRNLIKRNRY